MPLMRLKIESNYIHKKIDQFITFKWRGYLPRNHQKIECAL